MDYSAEFQNIISSKDKAIRHQSKQIETLQKENSQLHFYHDIFKGLPINIYCVDKKGDVIDCNNEQIRAMGFLSASEIIGKNLYDILRKEEADKIVENNKIIMESEISQIFEEKVVTNDGQERIYLSQKTPLYDENKNVIGIFGSAIDITERKRMENKLLEAEKALAEMKA